MQETDDPLLRRFEHLRNKSERRALPIAPAGHKPLNPVILMLGTNALKHRFSLLPCDAAAGTGELI